MNVKPIGLAFTTQRFATPVSSSDSFAQFQLRGFLSNTITVRVALLLTGLL